MLTGGNLSLTRRLFGKRLMKSETKDKILFIEDIGETPYRIDRNAAHAGSKQGKLRACAGILLGAFTDCAAPDPAESP